MKRVSLRPARPHDFEFCQRLYFEGLNLLPPRHSERFARQWAFAAVRIATLAGSKVAWLQTAPTDDALDLGQIYVDRPVQRQGIGRFILGMLIEEASRDNKAVTLGVARINPARRLYERLGFDVTYEDQDGVYMRREPDLPRK